MFYTAKKYSKNFKNHRINIFLQTKIKYNTENQYNLYYNYKFNTNIDLYFNALKFKKKSQIKKNFQPQPLKDNFIDLPFLDNKFNDNRFSDYFKSINLINKIDFSYFAEIFLNIFRYSYLIKFSFEFMFLLIVLYYLFNKGTFY